MQVLWRQSILESTAIESLMWTSKSSNAYGGMSNDDRDGKCSDIRYNPSTSFIEYNPADCVATNLAAAKAP